MSLTPTNRDLFIKAGLTVQGTATVTGPTGMTGTLQVNGGAAIAKDTYIGGLVNVNETITADGAIQTNDTTHASTTTPVASLVALGGAYIADNLVVSSTASNISVPDLNAVYVKGGAYIDGSLTVLGTINAFIDLAVNTATNLYGGLPDQIPYQNNVSDTTFSTDFTFDGSTFRVTTGVSSTSTETGSIITDGGVGIGENLNVGGNVTITGNLDVNQITSNHIDTDSLTATSITVTDINVENLTLTNIVVLQTADLNAVSAEALTATSIDIVSGIIDDLTVTNTLTTLDLVVTGTSVLNDISGNSLFVTDFTATNITVNNLSSLTAVISESFTTTDLQVTNIATISTATATFVWANTLTVQKNLVVIGDEQSISTQSGALQVLGGVGIGGNLYIGGELVVDKITVALTTITTTVVVTDDIIETTNGSDAINTLTGALRVRGGAGIGGDIHTGGRFYGDLTGVATTASFAILADFANTSTTATVSINALNAYLATTATNIAGGTAGQVPYQTAPGVTSFYGPGTLGDILVSQGTNAPVYQNTLTLAGTTEAVSTETGALQVRGGVGIGGKLYVNQQIYSEGAEVITTSTLGPLTVSMILAGTDTQVSTSTGAVTIWNNSTLQSVTERGSITNVAVAINNTLTVNTGTVEITSGADSSSTSTGALKVLGGVGVGGLLYAQDLRTVSDKVHIGQNAGLTNQGSNAVAIGKQAGENNQPAGSIIINASGSALNGTQAGLYVNPIRNDATSSATFSIAYYNPVTKEVTYNTRPEPFNGGTITLPLSITTQTNALDTTTGALIIGGGMGVGRDAYFGGDVNIQGAAIFEGPVIFQGTSTIVASSQTVYTDNIINLHSPPGGVLELWTYDDDKDIGHVYHWYDTQDRNAFLGLHNESGFLEWYSSGTLGTSTFVNGVYGTFRTGGIKLLHATASTGSATGALTVVGGVGVGGDVYARAFYATTSSYVDNALIITTATVNNYANQTFIYAGTDTAVNTSTGNITIWNTSTLQSITNRGNSTNNAISITNQTAATSTSTGALTVIGGVGIGEKLYVGGNLNVTGISNFAGLTTVTNTTNASSTITGALVVTGGVGIGKSLYTNVLFANTTSYVNNAEIITTATVNNYANQTFIYAGTDTAVNTSTGNITIWNTSTLQSVTNRGNSTTNILLVKNTTVSTSTITGALQVYGGVGVGESIYAGNDIYSANRIGFTSGGTNKVYQYYNTVTNSIDTVFV